MTSVRLAPETEERLTRLAEQTGRTKSFYINEAIEEELPRLEYIYGILDDVEKYRAGKLKTYTLEEVEEKYGLSDSDLE